MALLGHGALIGTSIVLQKNEQNATGFFNMAGNLVLSPPYISLGHTSHCKTIVFLHTHLK